MYEIKIHRSIVRQREIKKNKKKKVDISEGQCALEKIIMLIITLTYKKKRKKEKIYC